MRAAAKGMAWLPPPRRRRNATAAHKAVDSGMRTAPPPMSPTTPDWPPAPASMRPALHRTKSIIDASRFCKLFLDTPRGELPAKFSNGQQHSCTTTPPSQNKVDPATVATTAAATAAPPTTPETAAEKKAATIKTERQSKSCQQQPLSTTATTNNNNVTRRGPRSLTSEYRGVTQYKRTGRWESHVWSRRRQVHLGSFATPEEAARAFDIAFLRLRLRWGALPIEKEEEQQKQEQQQTQTDPISTADAPTSQVRRGGVVAGIRQEADEAATAAHVIAAIAAAQAAGTPAAAILPGATVVTMEDAAQATLKAPTDKEGVVDKGANAAVAGGAGGGGDTAATSGEEKSPLPTLSDEDKIRANRELNFPIETYLNNPLLIEAAKNRTITDAEFVLRVRKLKDASAPAARKPAGQPKKKRKLVPRATKEPVFFQAVAKRGVLSEATTVQVETKATAPGLMALGPPSSSAPASFAGVAPPLDLPVLPPPAPSAPASLAASLFPVAVLPDDEEHLALYDSGDMDELLGAVGAP